MTKAQLIAENKAQKEEIALLKLELAQLKKAIFGSKRERFIPETDSAQLSLFVEEGREEEVPVETEEVTYKRKKPKKKHPGRNELPKNLPVKEEVIEPEGDITGMKKIGEDITDTVEMTPAKAWILRTIRPRYVKEDEAGEEKIVQAPARTRTFPKSIVENSVVTSIIVDKFIDHLPFYRQRQRFLRDFEWKVSKSSMNDWFVAACTLMKPLYDTMVKKLLSSQYIQADESHIKVQDGSKKGACHQGYQWVYHAPHDKIVVFHYRKGRGVHGPKEFLIDYEGILQCDGYNVYDKIGMKPGIDLVGCLVHARRYFVKASDSGDKRADEILKTYQAIYMHERKCRERTAEERKKYRNEHVAPLFDELKTWADERVDKIRPKSPLGKAIRYQLGQWTKLSALLKDGQVELDNNMIENKVRPLALGRKNYLFAGNHNAAQRIAMMYSFFATCKANEVNPWQWLKFVLDHISDHKVNELECLIPRKGMFDEDAEQ